MRFAYIVRKFFIEQNKQKTKNFDKNIVKFVSYHVHDTWRSDDPQLTIANSLHTAANVSPIFSEGHKNSKNSAASLSAITPIKTFKGKLEVGTTYSHKSIQSVPR